MVLVIERHQKYCCMNCSTVIMKRNLLYFLMFMLERGRFMINITLQDSSWRSLCS